MRSHTFSRLLCICSNTAILDCCNPTRRIILRPYLPPCNSLTTTYLLSLTYDTTYPLCPPYSCLRQTASYPTPFPSSFWSLFGLKKIKMSEEGESRKTHKSICWLPLVYDASASSLAIFSTVESSKVTSFPRASSLATAAVVASSSFLSLPSSFSPGKYSRRKIKD